MLEAKGRDFPYFGAEPLFFADRDTKKKTGTGFFQTFR